jgi:hypothetical protein
MLPSSSRFHALPAVILLGSYMWKILDTLTVNTILIVAYVVLALKKGFPEEYWPGTGLGKFINIK